MTGRELIIYILKNGLEDEPVLKGGKFVGFMTAEELATKLGTGVATVKTWVRLNRIEAGYVTPGVYIPVNFMKTLTQQEGENNGN